MNCKKIIFFIAICNSSWSHLKAQQISDSINIQAKVWSKDENKQVHYTDWQNYSSVTIDLLKGFDKSKQIEKDKYSGFGKSYNKTGYFHTQKIDDRWNVINPLGHITYITAVNAIRTSKSSDLPHSFKDIDDWGKQTFDQINAIGFNTAGCWSDVDALIKYNATANKPMIYTIQLSLLSGYVSDAKKKDASRKGTSSLGFILDDGFPSFCENRASKLLATNTDPNLLGIFSDNEISFTNSEIKDIVKEKNTNDKAYQKLLEWLPNGTAPENMTDQQKQQFIALFAAKYYETVSKAIKKYDNNHLYIGSRIHSNAKNNSYLFKAANPFVDIISINYYGDWKPKQSYIDDWASWSDKPFFITEFYTKAEETGMSNLSGAGWIVKTHQDRGIHYQNFCLQLLKAKNCVGWHWFRYQDNDPNDAKADDSNKDSNKGIVNLNYEFYKTLTDKMKELNDRVYQLIGYFDGLNK